MHTITGSRKLNTDPETVGGILADEMGLGKTLTILASIVDSLYNSREFAGERVRGLRPNSRATLVIAPSVRKYYRPEDVILVYIVN